MTRGTNGRGFEQTMRRPPMRVVAVPRGDTSWGDAFALSTAGRQCLGPVASACATRCHIGVRRRGSLDPR